MLDKTKRLRDSSPAFPNFPQNLGDLAEGIPKPSKSWDFGEACQALKLETSFFNQLR